MSQRLPSNLQPVANPEPGSARAQDDFDAIVRSLQQIAGSIPYDDVDDMAPAQSGPDTPAEPGDDAEPDYEEVTGAEYTDHPQFDSHNGEMLYVVTDQGPRYLNQTPHLNGTIATNSSGDAIHLTDESGEMLRDEDGELIPIWVDEQGYQCDPPEPDDGKSRRGLGKLFNIVGSGGSSDSDDDGKLQAYDGQGVPIEDFTVVKAGDRFTGSNRRRGMKMTGFMAAGALAFAGMLFIGGVFLGTQRVPAHGAISAEEADKYQLTAFPVQQATAFGADYLRACLTHGNREQMEQRKKVIEQMSSPAAQSGCGWDEGGNVQEPRQIVFNGRVDEIDGYPIGEAAYLGYTVSMEKDTFTVTVPVWIGPTEGGGNAMQIVGDIGMAATPPAGVAPNRPPETNTDTQLAGKLNNEVLGTFFTAWGASDTQQLHLVLSKSATTDALTGLDGVVTSPEIDRVTAFSPKARSDGSAVEYVDGDTATLHVTVTWKVAASDSMQTTGYRVSVVLEAGQWRVRDINSGLIGAGGGSNSRMGSEGFTDTEGQAGEAGSPGSAGAEESGGSLGGTDSLQSGGSDETGSVPIPGGETSSAAPTSDAESP